MQKTTFSFTIYQASLEALHFEKSSGPAGLVTENSEQDLKTVWYFQKILKEF